MVDKVTLLLVVSPTHQDQDVKDITSVFADLTLVRNIDEVLGLLNNQRAVLLIASPEELNELRQIGETLQRIEPLAKFPVVFLGNDPVDWTILQDHPHFYLADSLQLPIDPRQLSCRLQMLKELQVCCMESDRKELALEVIQTELEEKTVELKALSAVDEVTGLFNQHYFDENMTREWRRAARLKQEIGLLTVEVDGFSRWCKVVESPVSDLILRGVGMVLHESLMRPMDIVARREDGVFTILLPDTDRQGVLAVANRVQLAVGEYLGDEQLKSANLSLLITGAVMMARGDDSSAVLLRLAAQARKEVNLSSADTLCVLSRETLDTSP